MGKYLILNCDDFGVSDWHNEAMMKLMKHKKVSSATLIVAGEAAERAAVWAVQNKDCAVGLHIAFTTEWVEDKYRFKPLSAEPSLCCTDGLYMHRNSSQVSDNATPQAVDKEIEMQFAQMHKWGVDISHADNHMGSVYGNDGRNGFLPQVFKHCIINNVGFRLPKEKYVEHHNMEQNPKYAEMIRPAIELAAQSNVFLPDYLIWHDFSPKKDETYKTFKASLIEKLTTIPENIIVETYIHPSVESDVVKFNFPSYPKRVWEYELFFDPDMDYAIKESGVKLITYKEGIELRKQGLCKN